MRNRSRKGAVLFVFNAVYPALGAEVTSDNVVGYTKIGFNRGLTIIGQQFSAVGGEDSEIQTIAGEGMNEDGGDFIRIWDGAKYDGYSYYPGDTCDINGDGTDAWGDLDWVPVDITIPAGTGMWISANDSASLTFSGEVSDKTTVSFVRGLNLICVPQPIAVTLQDVKGEGMNEDGGDFIRIWDGTKYEGYSYYPGDTCDILGDGTDAWGDLDWEPVDVTIPVGTGFWLSANGSGSLIFPDGLAK